MASPALDQARKAYDENTTANADVKTRAGAHAHKARELLKDDDISYEKALEAANLAREAANNDVGWHDFLADIEKLALELRPSDRP